MIHLSKAHPISALSEAPCQHGDSETDLAQGLPLRGKGSMWCDRVMTTAGRAGDQRLSAWEDLGRASEKW